MLAIFCRFIFIFLLIFFVLPIFWPSLGALLTRTQLFLLSIIAIEFLASKISNLMQGLSGLEAKKPRIRTTNASVDAVLANRKLSLFVHTKNVAIDKLIPRSMYKEFAAENDETVKIFDHYDKPIISMEMEYCRQALKSFVVYPDFARVLKAVKKSYADTVTFVIAAQDLSLIFFQKELLIQLQGCALELGAFLSRKMHINLIIDNMSAITGFHSFCNFALQNDLDLMNIVVPVKGKNEKHVSAVFETNFVRFSDKIDAAIRRTNFTQVGDAQNAITFAQQLQYLKGPLREIMLALLSLSKDGGNFFSSILVNMHFLSSMQDFSKKSDILPKELQLCLAGKEDALKRFN
jgi:hypothetical protein